MEHTNQALPADVNSDIQPESDLQTLFMSFKNPKQRQVKGLKDEVILKVYQKNMYDNLNWTAVMEDDDLSSMMFVRKRHEKRIRELLMFNKKSVQRRTLGGTLLDTSLSDQHPSTTRLGLQPVTMSTEEGRERHQQQQ